MEMTKTIFENALCNDTGNVIEQRHLFHLSTASVNGSAPNRLQAIIWTNDILWHWYQNNLGYLGQYNACGCTGLLLGIVDNYALQWRHNECDGISNHQPHDCLPNGLLRRKSKKTLKLRVTGLCDGNSPVTGEFSAQKASNAENISIWWRHEGNQLYKINVLVSPWGTILIINA